MKKILSVLANVILLCSITAHGQNCKFDVDKKDPFSGKSVRSISHIIGPKSWRWTLTLTKEDTTYKITLFTASGGILEEIIEKGRMISIKLENEKILELLSDADVIPQHAVFNGQAITYYTITCTVSRKYIVRLSKSPITDLKISYGNQDILLPKITSKQTDKIVEAASCMLQD